VSLKKALKNRDDFLREHPQMQEYQNLIDDVLSKCTNQNDRLIAILIMLNSKINELENILNASIGKRIQ
jgi:hypothetical protein